MRVRAQPTDTRPGLERPSPARRRIRTPLAVAAALLAAPAFGARDTNVEALKARLPEAKGREAVEILEALSAQALRREHHAAVVEYATQGLMLLDTAPDPKLRARLLRTLCHSFVDRRDPSGARPHCERGITLARELGDHDLHASLLAGLGTAYWTLGELDQAMRLQLEALAVAENAGNDQRTSDALHRIAILYRDLGDFDRSLASNARAIALREALGDRRGLSATLNNVGLVYIERGDIDTAFRYLQRSLALKDELGLDASRVYPLTHLGRIHELRGEYDKALDLLGQAERVAAASRNATVGAEIHSAKAAAYRGQGQYDQAMASANRAIAAAETVGARKQLRDAVAERSRVLAAQGRYREALDEHHRYKGLDDTLRSEQVGRRIAEAQGRHELLQRESQIAMLQKDQALRRVESERQGLLQNSLAGGVLLLGATLGLLANRYRLKSRANQLIMEANADLNAADRIVRDVNHEIDLSGLLSRLLERVMELVPHTDRGTVLLADPDGETLRVAARTGFGPEAPDEPVLTRDEAVTRFASPADTTDLAPGIHLRRGQTPATPGAPAQPCRLAVSLAIEGRLDGYLILESSARPDAFGLAAAEQLARLRGHIVAGVEKARMLERLRIENEKLKDALTQVDLLGALLPICSSCKRIRDDSGYWHQVESYISAHGGASFTHGICPPCAEAIYPQFASHKPAEP